MTDPDLVASHIVSDERNVLVHGYQDVDLDVVVDAAAHRLEDLTAFVAAIRRKLTAG